MLEQLFYCHVPMSHLENAIKWYKEILHIVKRSDKHN